MYQLCIVVGGGGLAEEGEEQVGRDGGFVRFGFLGGGFVFGVVGFVVGVPV